MTTKDGAPHVNGWGPTELRTTEGYIYQSVGTTIGTQAIGSQLGYWRKKE
jgi:hypothetical protein